MSRLFEMRAVRRVHERLGDGTFEYVGAQGAGEDAISVWQYKIYGGLQMTDDRESPSAVSRSVGCITGGSKMFEKHPFK